MNKKAQITLFIIVGLVLLLGVTLSIALYQDVLRFRPPEESVIAEVPTELKPLQFAVQQCQENLADDAIRRALAQGGYIEPLEAGIIALPPPAGTAMDAQGLTVAYWTHINDGQRHNEQPQLYGARTTALSEQISDYVDERIEGCVPFDDFPQYGIDLGVPTTFVSFQDTATTVSTRWPMRITTSLGETDLEEFAVRLDAPVKNLFDTAEAFVDELWLSRMPALRTMDWVSLYGTVNGPLPPIAAGARQTRDIRPFSLQSTKGQLADVLMLHAESIELADSRQIQHIRYEDAEVINQLYLSGITTAVGATPQNQRLEGLYTEDFGMWWTVDGNPGVAMPEIQEGAGILGGIVPPIVDYSFDYDLTYPILFRLEENGYELQFAYEVNIDNNGPMWADDIQEQAAAGTTCSAPGGQLIDIETTPDDVQAYATYECAGVTCALGEVIDGRLTAQLPACARGTLEVNSPDRFSEPYELSSAADGPRLRRLFTLHEPREVEVNVFMRPLYAAGDNDWAVSQNAVRTDAQVLLIRQGAPYFASPDEDGVAKLVPGRYDTMIFGIQEWPEDDQFIIESREECIDPGLIGGIVTDEEDTCYTLPQLNFTSLPTVYGEYDGENAIVIDRRIDELNITAVGYNPYEMISLEDISIIGAMFNLSAQQDWEENVRMR